MGLVGHIGLEGIDDKVSLHKKVGTYLAKSFDPQESTNQGGLGDGNEEDGTTGNRVKTTSGCNS